MNQFEEAADAYRSTIENYPGSDAALKARKKLDVLEGIMGGGAGSPHVSP